MLDKTNDRAALRALYGVDFPDELFAIADWHRGLTGEPARALRDVLGVSLHGPFDALAGKLAGPLRYPAVLHWRYQYDLPELFTVMVGNTDGLHWGYWFDDPGRLPPVVASFYARDGVDLTEHASLAHALEDHSAAVRASLVENREHDSAEADTYDRDLAALDELDATLPTPRPQPARVTAVETPDGMGIVVARAQLGTWLRPADGVVDPGAALAFVDAEIAAGRPGTALLVGRVLWDGAKLVALDAMARAYAALDRAPLRAVALAHRTYPAIPSLDIASYKPGDYTDLADAVAHIDDVVELNIPARGLTALPAELAGCGKLAVAWLYNNKLAELPAALCGLPALRVLELGKNQLRSVDGIERCTALEELGLGDNPIDHLPDGIGALAKLRKLDVGRTLLDADAHARLRAALPGCEIVGKPVAAAADRKPYSMKATYAVDDTLAHPTFGVGVVRKLLADKRIEVAFDAGVKILAHGRG
jgi:hypothetical protein